MADLFPPAEDTTNMSVMYALFRESPAGQLLRLVTRNKILQYPEEKPGYKVPQEWLDVLNSEKPPSPAHAPGSSASSVRPLDGAEADDKDKITPSPPDADTDTVVDTDTEKAAGPAQDLDLTQTRSQPIIPRRTKDGLVLVDYYTTDDPANPYNWPRSQKLTSTFILCFYTFVIYASSSIYLPSIPGIIAEYRVGQVEASLGLALYVLVSTSNNSPDFRLC
jgi:MFS transporter, DHA1 family, multidrug resistance protein